MGRPKMSEEEKLAARQKREAQDKENRTTEQIIDDTKVILQKIKDNDILDLKSNQTLVNKPETKQVAFSIAKDKDTGRWYVIKIMYDLASGTVSSPVKLGEGDDRSIAFERFKIEAGTAFMGDL